MAANAIVFEQLPDGQYLATCPVFPQLKAVAPTEEEARQALEEAIDALLRQRAEEELRP
jgi:predicted RNase H-like HicB family nuclease